ncbi:MAG: Na/Pi cotransporter family protein [Pirellulaceae bacterium]|nr:Na/Pi cotransporter family protein [Pirellulaceae bacterium]
MDTSTLVHLFCTLLGGLGLFLLGMKNMSDGMQAIAGESLRRLIGLVTNNRLMAAAVGTLSTCIVQSSSITTVLAVGFVNSGLMTLRQAVGVIMGANIGTTITGWILVLEIGKYGLPIIGIAVLLYLFSRADRWRYVGLAALGIGLVFFGLETMKEACAIVKTNPQFVEWFHQFHADSYLGVLKCVLIGCVLTAVVQSSSATLGITISLATQGLIDYQTAGALVLGENIGTTITALLASIGTTTAARRAAYFHSIFNVLGVLWISSIFAYYIRLIEYFVGIEPGQATLSSTEISSSIALTHSLFNIANTMLFLPFVPLIVKILESVAPNKEFKEKPKLTDLDIRYLDTPALAIERSRNEVLKMGDGCEKMLRWLEELQDQEVLDTQLENRLKHREQVFDSVQDEVSSFVTDLLAKALPHKVADEARRQLTMADEYESISDYFVGLDKFDRKLRKSGLRYTLGQREQLGQLNGMTLNYLKAVNSGVARNDPNVARDTDNTSKEIRSRIKQFRKQHLEDLSKGDIAPQISVAFLAALNAYARIRDHLENIAETVTG